MSLLRSRAPGYDVSVLAPSLHQPLAVEGCLLVKDRYECAGVRSAIVIGGPGPDRIFTDVPATVLGGPGPDELFNRVGGAIDGGPGDDQLTPAKAVTVAGGTGIDTVLLRRRELAPLRVTFDGVADDGLPGEAVNVLADVEDVLTEPEYDRHDYSPDAGPRTMVGTDAANHLFGSYGDDAISGGKGSDELYGMDGDDRLDARDGEPDRVVCGDDDDVALVDPVDLVSATCERVIRTP
jgi:Ca2+-binding RTX toxin-like protein